MGKLVFGVGVNDADYPVKPTINGKQIICPFYRTWQNMMNRCYSAKYQEKFPTYTGCAVSAEWLTFSNFKVWMEKQDWQGKELDKDIIFKGNKIYSSETCVFVDSVTNSFTLDRSLDRGEWPIGVYLSEPAGKFRAQCGNPFTEKRESLGCFTCPREAHEAWRKRKHELALRLADLQSDSRVADAIRSRYI